MQAWLQVSYILLLATSNICKHHINSSQQCRDTKLTVNGQRESCVILCMPYSDAYVIRNIMHAGYSK
jgi:hypothetical protein